MPNDSKFRQQKARYYLVLTKYKGEYNVHKTEDGVWLIDIYVKGAFQKRTIISIGGRSAEDIEKLDESFVGKKIKYQSDPNVTSTEPILSIKILFG